MISTSTSMLQSLSTSLVEQDCSHNIFYSQLNITKLYEHTRFSFTRILHVLEKLLRWMDNH